MPPPSTHDLLAHAGFVRSLANRLIRDRQRAEDVAQDALVAALERPPERRDRLRAWLRAVTRNLAFKAGRSEQRRRNREHEVARPESHSLDPDPILRERIAQAVLELDAPSRTVVLLRYFDGHSAPEIAARLGETHGAVRSRLRRALDVLRGRLDREYGDRRAWIAPAATLFGGVRIGLAVAAVACVGLVAWMWPRDESDVVRGGLRFNSERTAMSSKKRDDLDARAAPEGAAKRKTETALRVIDRDLDLHGVVIDPAGRPVVGAQVRALFHPWRRVNAHPDGEQFAEVPGPHERTGEDGRFALRLRRGDVVTLRIRAAGFAPRSLPQRQAGERVRVRLETGVRLRVRVEGAPSGTTVALIAADRAMRQIRYRRERPTTDDGACVFEQLAGGEEVRLHVAVPGTMPHIVPVRYVSLPETGETECRLEVPPLTVGTGRVIDAATNQPIAGATLGPVHAGKAVRTDVAGRFKLRGKPGGSFVVRAPRYGSARARLGDDVEVKLHRGFTLRGRVVSAAGAPVPGAQAMVMVFGSGFVWDFLGARTGADGRFEIGNLGRRPFALTLLVMARGHGRTLIDLNPAGTGDLELGDVRLHSGHALTGRVLDESGRPAARVRVDLRGSNDDRGRRGAKRPRHSFGNHESRHTDDLGRFRFDDLAPGSYELRSEGGESREITVPRAGSIDLRMLEATAFVVSVRESGGGPAHAEPVLFETADTREVRRTGDDGVATMRSRRRVRAVRIDGVRHAFPQDSRVLEITLRPRALVAGRVIDTRGKPVAFSFTAAGRQQRTAKDGRFRVVVAPGDVVTFVPPVAWEGTRRGIVAGTTGIVWRVRKLPRDRNLRVRVTTPFGEPVPGVVVTAMNSKPTGTDGDVSWTGLPRGPLALKFRLPHDHPRAASFFPPRSVALAADTEDIAVRLLLGRLVSGRAPGATLVELREHGQWRRSVEPAADGRFRILVPPGDDWTLHASDGAAITIKE